MLVHRAIKHALRVSMDVSKGSDFAMEKAEQFLKPSSLEDLGNLLSYTERRAEEAARDVASWLKCEFLLDKIGKEVEGVVVGVQSCGLFILMDELFVEGLIHVKALPRDYYYYEDKLQRLVGERSGQVFKLGQRIKAIVSRVDLQKRKIDLTLFRRKRGKQGKKSAN